MSTIQNPTPALTADNLRASTEAAPSLDELIYALSSVLRVRERAPTQPLIHNPQMKHLSLLDGIALLLVTEDKADVAAVSFLQSSTSIEFYYAKNRPCASITGYIESLLEVLRNYEPSKSKKAECIRNIVRTAVPQCIKKIRNRIRNVSGELTKSGLHSRC